VEYDLDRVDEMTLALLYLVTTDRQEGQGGRAWRGFDSRTIKRLHDKGWIEDPESKALSLHLTEEGLRRSERLFKEHFGLEEE
jgi:hypothetical protein